MRVSAAWLSGDALAFDVESTGTDVFGDRIVTACAVLVGQSGAFFRGRWLLNPGVPIPAAATAVHGITDDMALVNGMDPATALDAISNTLTDAWGLRLPVIIMNAHFDLSMLRAELERYELPKMRVGPVLDPLVIDRACDPYRKGRRNLTALAHHYIVKQDAAHTSDGDALTAARVVWRQARAYVDLQSKSLDEMQAFQAKAHAEWAGQFEVRLRQQGRPEAINRDWPVRRAA